MSLCFHKSSDRAIVYPYKTKLQGSLGLAFLYLTLGLPLFVLINGSMFDARQKSVYEVAFLAEAIDLKTTKNVLPVMQFDDALTDLNRKGLCQQADSTNDNGDASSSTNKNDGQTASGTKEDSAPTSVTNTGSAPPKR